MNGVAETAGETRTRKNKRPEETTHIGGRQCLQDATVRHQLDVGRTLGFLLYFSFHRCGWMIQPCWFIQVLITYILCFIQLVPAACCYCCCRKDFQSALSISFCNTRLTHFKLHLCHITYYKSFGKVFCIANRNLALNSESREYTSLKLLKKNQSASKRHI